MTGFDLDESKVLAYLLKIRNEGNLDQFNDRVRIFQARDDTISSKELIQILCSEGKLSDFEARKITLFLEVNNKVSVPKLHRLLDKAL